MAKNIIAIEINQETLSVVEIVSYSSGTELVRYAIRDLPPSGYTAAWLKAIWHQEHFSHHRIILMLPNNLMKYKTITIPVLPQPELEAAIKLELANSGGRDDIWKIVNLLKQDQMYQVKLALIDNNQLKEEMQIIHQAGLEVIWSGLRCHGIQNFIRFNAGYFDLPGENSAYLDFNGDQVEFAIINEDQIAYSRYLGFNSHDLTAEDNQELVTDFLDELHLSLAAYGASSKTTAPVKVGVFGETEAALFFEKTIFDQLGCQLYFPEKSMLTGVITHKFTPILAPLIGLALDETGIFERKIIRVYTREQDRTILNRSRLRVGAFIGFMALLLLSGLVLGTRANLEKEARIQGWLASKAHIISRLHRVENETTQNLHKTKQLETWLATQGRELDFLLLLQTNLPDGTRITDLTIEDGVIKDLAGVTPSASFLLNKFKAIPGLQSLKVKGSISASNEGELFQLEGIIGGKEPTK